jgi:hypothetical protein
MPKQRRQHYLHILPLDQDITAKVDVYENRHYLWTPLSTPTSETLRIKLKFLTMTRNLACTRIRVDEDPSKELVRLRKDLITYLQDERSAVTMLP